MLFGNSNYGLERKVLKAKEIIQNYSNLTA